MAIPKVTVSLVEGALGIPPEQTDNKIVVFGYCSAGTANALYDFDGASPSTVKGTLGVGRLAQLVASMLATPNHGPIVAVPLASTAGVNSAVTATGTTPPAVTLSGGPHDDFGGRVEILVGGALGTATFRYSLDYNAALPAQASWSQELTTAATYVMPDSGVTLNFPGGAAVYNADNRYSWTSTAPTHSNTNVTAGIDAVIANGVDFGWSYVSAAMGGATDADRVTALSSLFAAVSAKIDALETAYKFVGCTLEAPSPVNPTTAAGLTEWRSALVSGTSTLSHKRMQIAAGYARRATDITITGYSLPRRPIGFSVIERISQAPISEHLGNILNGKLRSLVSIEHDEETTGGLDSARFTTLRTVAGRQGFYVNRGWQFAATSSDYSATPRLRVINTASKTLRNAALNYLNSTILVDSATSKIREDEAQAIDADCTSQLNAVLVQPGHASSVAARCSRTDLILSTSTLNIEGAVQPVGYAETIPISLGFTRATSAAA